VKAVQGIAATAHRGTDHGIRRVIDVLFAALGLALFLPLMLIIAVAVSVDTPGPVFFSHVRLGCGGRHFRIYKFRKFYHCPGTTGQAVTVRGDRRMTPVGRLLERTKLDELPQLWNVLIGDMSMVGPRPETLEFADCFTGPFRKILEYTPGLFGPNQVLFRNESSLFPPNQDPHEFYRTVLFSEKARTDLSYFPRRTLLSDLGWIVRGTLLVFGLPVFYESGRAGDTDVEETQPQPEPPVAAITIVREHD
jgi:lipopolysaccharide/colanic/teichoic acid biosynthesis glycosyltransferase